MVHTYRDYLVAHHGLAPQHNPPVVCACGRTTAADMCVDLVPLPMRIRRALGLDQVDFLCDGCQSRLFCNRHIAEDEFYAMLGADVPALYEHNASDREWQQGVALRHAAHQPRHVRVSLAAVGGYADAGSVPVMAPIPLQHREASHEQQAQALADRYALTNIVRPPDTR